MEERFKSYLEEQFRKIAPTRAAMQYRKQMLADMLDRAQDLRIKGMKDEELIFKTVISEFDNLDVTLRDFEDEKIKRAVKRKSITLCIAVNFALTVLFVLAYLIVGFAAHIWHPTWLIIVCGTLLQVVVPLVAVTIKSCRKKQFVVARLLIAGVEALIAVIVFLLLQLVGGIQGSWMVFLAMVALIAVVDLIFACLSKNTIVKWIELPIVIETVFAMLYVILGISLAPVHNIWHPAWLMCLAGFVVALVEIIVLTARRAVQKKKEADEENTVVDESYWTRWD